MITNEKTNMKNKMKTEKMFEVLVDRGGRETTVAIVPESRTEGTIAQYRTMKKYQGCSFRCVRRFPGFTFSFLAAE